MKIKYEGISDTNGFRPIFLGFTLGLVFHYCTFQIQDILDASHKALLQSSISNVTSINIERFCGSPYDDCRCSVQATKNIYLKDCLTDDFLLGSRIFPLVSFILQICLVRDLFTFRGKYTRFVIYGLWTAVVFIFVITANGIYRSSCFHRQINIIFAGTGGSLFILVLCSLLKYRDSVHSRSNHYNSFNDCCIIDDETTEETTDDETTEEITNQSIVWRDLL